MTQHTIYSFVLGTGRCGSTLVDDVLARHPAAGYISSWEDKYRLPKAAVRVNGLVYRNWHTRRVPNTFRAIPEEGYNLLAREVSPALVSPFRDLRADDATPWLAARFHAFFADRARIAAKPVFLHKFTGWPRARFIQAVFPDARFVHVVRDGRAVANSFLQQSWWLGYHGPDHWQYGPLPEPYREEWEASGRSFVMLAGIMWKMLIDAFVETEATVPPEQWLTVRYEDLLAAPAESFKRLAAHIGLPPDPAFDAIVEGWPLYTSRSEAFRGDLGPRDVEMLDRSLAGHLELLGYTV